MVAAILAPQYNPVMRGHVVATTSFMQAVQGRLHHAWLLHGMRGIGKSTFAYHCANYLLSGGRQTIGALNVQDKDFKLIAAGAHPDLLVVAAPVDEKTGIAKNEIPVDAVRVLTGFFQKTSGRGGWRVAIIRGADTLNRNAANALLKILEEPPERGILLMTAEARGKLLPTIRSRCRPLALLPPAAADMAAIMQGYQHDLPPEGVRQLQLLAGGSPGVALHLLQHDGLALYKDFLALLQAPPHGQTAALLRFAGGGGGKMEAERFTLITGFCLDWLQRLIRLMASGDVMEITVGEGQLLRRMAALRSLQDWLVIADVCQARFAAAVQANLDKRLALIDNLRQILPHAA